MLASLKQRFPQPLFCFGLCCPAGYFAGDESDRCHSTYLFLPARANYSTSVGKGKFKLVRDDQCDGPQR